MPRYNRYKILNNNNEYYKPLRKSRGLKNIRHYETPILHNPTIRQRMSVTTTSHIWTYGDRLYKLANQYYGDVKFWWVIAWYNGTPTEAHLLPGDVIEVPVNIEAALKALGEGQVDGAF